MSIKAPGLLRRSFQNPIMKRKLAGSFIWLCVSGLWHSFHQCCQHSSVGKKGENFANSEDSLKRAFGCIQIQLNLFTMGKDKEAECLQTGKHYHIFGVTVILMPFPDFLIFMIWTIPLILGRFKPILPVCIKKRFWSAKWMPESEHVS